jgi:hypothetical protein
MQIIEARPADRPSGHAPQQNFQPEFVLVRFQRTDSSRVWWGDVNFVVKGARIGHRLALISSLVAG